MNFRDHIESIGYTSYSLLNVFEKMHFLTNSLSKIVMYLHLIYSKPISCEMVIGYSRIRWGLFLRSTVYYHIRWKLGKELKNVTFKQCSAICLLQEYNEGTKILWLKMLKDYSWTMPFILSHHTACFSLCQNQL